jgi:ATP-binding cassette subfamily B protein
VVTIQLVRERIHERHSETDMNLPAWRYYISFYKGLYRSLFFSILVSAGQPLIVVSIALLIRYAFDDVIPARHFQLLAVIGVSIVILHLLNGGLAIWTRRAIGEVVRAANQKLRDKVLKKLYTLSRSYYSEADRNRLHTVAVQDTNRIGGMSGGLLGQLIPAICISAALAAILIYLNWFLFLVMISIVPPLAIAGRLIGMALSKQARAWHLSFEKFSRGISFVLQMMDLTRIQSAEEIETGRQRQNISELHAISAHVTWLTSVFGLVQDTIVAISGAIILIVGGRAIVAGDMTLGELFSFSAAVALLKPYLTAIFRWIPSIIEGNESLTALYELMETENARPYSGTRRIPFSGKVTLASVSFRYKDDPILHDINLTIHPGTRVAIVGPNGSGKTTIANLILGFYHPQRGQLYADDYPFSELDIVHLRRHIGAVTQNPIIFPGTIHENITYGHPDATFKQVVQAAELATAHEFIQQLPHGYETFVGEDGMLLSGGQGQRIAIARALLHRPKLLILDEPTNHLDTVAVNQLLRNLGRLDNAPAILIISHDMDVVRQAQSIHILQEGCIVACEHPTPLFQKTAIEVK